MTENDMRNRELIAQLRGFCGSYRRALQDIKDTAPPGTPAHDIAGQALQVENPDVPAQEAA